MSISTKIQWCDSTCNPTMGCGGCELWDHNTKKCYAGVLHVRFGGATKGYAPSFDEVTLFPGRMGKAAKWSDLRDRCRPEKPWLDGYPRLIFVSDMSDALSEVVDFDFLKSEVIDVVTSVAGQRHCWLWLTKRPSRMAKFSQWLLEAGIKWPENLWPGTSVTSQRTTSRVRHLLRVGDDRTIRFLSVEPQHEEIDLSKWLPHLQWVIQGGESGHDAVGFDVGWARSLLRQCRKHSVAYFLKQLGAVVCEGNQRLMISDSHAGDWEEWPDDLRVRELPPLQVAAFTEVVQNNADGEGDQVRKNAALAAKRRRAALKAWETRRAKAAAMKEV